MLTVRLLSYMIELIRINNWIKANNLKISVDKTNFILFQNRSVRNYFPPLTQEGMTYSELNRLFFFKILLMII